MCLTDYIYILSQLLVYKGEPLLDLSPFAAAKYTAHSCSRITHLPPKLDSVREALHTFCCDKDNLDCLKCLTQAWFPTVPANAISGLFFIDKNF